MAMSRFSSTCLSAIAGVALLSACGCGGEWKDAGVPEASFGTEPLTTVTSDDGLLRVTVYTAPQPVVRGTNRARLDVALSDGGVAPSELSVAAQTWMPAMGHGSAVKPSVQPDGGGGFELSNVTFPMAGTWELRLTFSGAVSSHATANVDVP